MAWVIPTEKHASLKERYHTCTCDPGTEKNYEWKRMRVVDVDFEQPTRATDERRIWYTIGCYDCRHEVLDDMPFGIEETGYSLLSAAKAESAEYIIDLNGGFLAAEHELAIRVETAEAVRDKWDSYHKGGGKIDSSPHLLMQDAELQVSMKASVY